MRVSTRIMLVFLIAFLMAVFLAAALIPQASQGKLTTRYSVQSYESDSSHGSAWITYIGKVENSDGYYTAKVAPSDTIVLPDAVDGKCVLEDNSFVSVSILHVAPDQGVCITQ